MDNLRSTLVRLDRTIPRNKCSGSYITERRSSVEVAAGSRGQLHGSVVRSIVASLP